MLIGNDTAAGTPQVELSRGLAADDAAVPSGVGGCHGHANTPHSASDQYGNAGIGYDGYMDCVGSFGSQKVCVKLQEKNYYGDYFDVTGPVCNSATVNTHAYIGRWVSCVQAFSGNYRTYFQGTAYPFDQPAQAQTALSLSANMCAGHVVGVGKPASGDRA